jgi:hypothetical protein
VLGFLNKAMFLIREILKMINRMVFGRLFSRMENPAGRDIKRRASIMASTLCGMKMAANEWKGLTRTGKSMGGRLAGTQTEQGGNINSMISGSQKEPGQPGIIKEIFFQK